MKRPKRLFRDRGPEAQASPLRYCILCGRLREYVVMWEPGPEQARKLESHGVPPGSKVWYALCEHCRLLPDHLEAIETKLMDQIMADLAVREN